MIVITGITGLVGSHIASELLYRGESIRAVVRADADTYFVRRILSLYHANAGELFNRIEFVNGDMLQYDSLLDAFEGADMVIHAAGMVSFDPHERKKVIETNVTGTANVVNACIECRVKQLGYVSSVAAIGNAADGELVTETTPWENSGKNSGYSISKFHAELEVWRGIQEGLHAVIVNPTIIIGPGHWDKGSASMISASYNGMRFYTTGIMGYVDVRDVCHCLIALLDKKISGQRYVLNSDNCTYREIFTLAARAMGVKEPSIAAPKWLVKFTSTLDWLASLFGKQRQITRETAKTAFDISRYSNEKIVNELEGFQFIPVSRSITETAALFLRQVER
jgi:dihydroflavonol-4-reductase